jgi:hypothetical protein
MTQAAASDFLEEISFPHGVFGLRRAIVAASYLPESIVRASPESEMNRGEAMGGVGTSLVMFGGPYTIFGQRLGGERVGEYVSLSASFEGVLTMVLERRWGRRMCLSRH